MQRHRFMCPITDSMEDGDGNRRWMSSLKPFKGAVSGRPEVDIGRRKWDPRAAGTGRYKGEKVNFAKPLTTTVLSFNFFKITIDLTFNIAILSYMSYLSIFLSASEWIISRFMALYKCTYNYYHQRRMCPLCS